MQCLVLTPFFFPFVIIVFSLAAFKSHADFAAGILVLGALLQMWRWMGQYYLVNKSPAKKCGMRWSLVWLESSFPAF